MYVGIVGEYIWYKLQIFLNILLALFYLIRLIQNGEANSSNVKMTRFCSALYWLVVLGDLE